MIITALWEQYYKTAQFMRRFLGEKIKLQYNCFSFLSTVTFSELQNRLWPREVVVRELSFWFHSYCEYCNLNKLLNLSDS